MEPLSSVVLGCFLPVMAATITARHRGYPESNGEPHAAGINRLHVSTQGLSLMALRRGAMIPVVSDADTLRPALIYQLQEVMNVRSA
jgi:hypothetical protein